MNTVAAVRICTRIFLVSTLLWTTACDEPPRLETTIVQPTASVAAEIFPLHVAPNGRYLEDRSGRPFLIHGDTAWSLMVQLSREEADLYLADRRARGFNTLLVNLIEHKFSDSPPRNHYGDAPFRVPGDFSTPNESYFKHADWVLDRARELGFTVLLVPAYLGFGGGDQGWYQELLASPARNLRQYGWFLAERYRNLDNIIWTHGGDYNPPRRRTVEIIADAIHEISPERLATAHCVRGTAAVDYWGDEPWLTLNNAYTADPVVREVLRQYQRPGAMPFFLLEGIYEMEREASTGLVRRQAYQALLSGAAGHMFGNNPIWHFDGPGLFPAPVTWREALDSPGSRSMSVLWNLFGSIEWWNLVPAIGPTLLANDSATQNTEAVASVTHDGSLAVVYLATNHAITIDFNRMAGSRRIIEWIDPTSGRTALKFDEALHHETPYQLSPPGYNDAGDTDWILLVRMVD